MKRRGSDLLEEFVGCFLLGAQSSNLSPSAACSETGRVHVAQGVLPGDCMDTRGEEEAKTERDGER